MKYFLAVGLVLVSLQSVVRSQEQQNSINANKVKDVFLEGNFEQQLELITKFANVSSFMNGTQVAEQTNTLLLHFYHQQSVFASTNQKTATRSEAELAFRFLTEKLEMYFELGIPKEAQGLIVQMMLVRNGFIGKKRIEGSRANEFKPRRWVQSINLPKAEPLEWRECRKLRSGNFLTTTYDVRGTVEFSFLSPTGDKWQSKRRTPPMDCICEGFDGFPFGMFDVIENSSSNKHFLVVWELNGVLFLEEFSISEGAVRRLAFPICALPPWRKMSKLSDDPFK